MPDEPSLKATETRSSCWVRDRIDVPSRQGTPSAPATRACCSRVRSMPIKGPTSLQNASRSLSDSISPAWSQKYQRLRRLHGGVEAKGPQHAHAVGLHRNTATLGAPHRVALDELHRKTLAPERTAEREPGDPTPNDQHCLDFGHISSDYGAAQRRSREASRFGNG